MDEVESGICAILRGEAKGWNPGTGITVPRFLAAARYHDVLPLLDAALRRSEVVGLPAELREACRDARRAQAVFELAHRAEMIRVFDALAAAGATALVLKGTALAYNLYPNPALRPRGDTDLLIPEALRGTTDRVLDQLGYRQCEGGEGDLIHYESTWERADPSGLFHVLDIHWRINNSQVLSRLLEHDELAARAVALPALGPHARALSPVDALLFACIHRAGHAHAPVYVDGVPHHGIDRLIWLFDIHLLLPRLTAPELEAFVNRARERRMKAICRDALSRAQERFATVIPPGAMDALAALDPDSRVEPSSRFLCGGRFRLMVDNAVAMRSWRERLAWLGQIAMPSAAHMRRKYPDAASAWLPLLYLRRATAGFARLFKRDAATPEAETTR